MLPDQIVMQIERCIPEPEGCLLDWRPAADGYWAPADDASNVGYGMVRGLGGWWLADGGRPALQGHGHTAAEAEANLLMALDSSEAARRAEDDAEAARETGNVA